MPAPWSGVKRHCRPCDVSARKRLELVEQPEAEGLHRGTFLAVARRQQVVGEVAHVDRLLERHHEPAVRQVLRRPGRAARSPRPGLRSRRHRPSPSSRRSCRRVRRPAARPPPPRASSPSRRAGRSSAAACDAPGRPASSASAPASAAPGWRPARGCWPQPIAVRAGPVAVAEADRAVDVLLAEVDRLERGLQQHLDAPDARRGSPTGAGSASASRRSCRRGS